MVVRAAPPPAEPTLNPAPGFFRPDTHGALVPDPSAHSPWGPDMLHGRLLAGVVARAVEADGAEAFRPVRLTVDLFRAAPMEPVEVSSEVVRSGGRVRALNVSLTCAGREVVRGSALLLRQGAQPSGRVWQPDPWDVPDPDSVPVMGADAGAEPEGPSGATADSVIEIRLMTPGGFTAAAQKRLWVRETRPLVEGEELSPFVRLAQAADLTNPFGNSGQAGLHFINADLSLYAGRLPVGEWIGMEITGRVSADGVAVAESRLHDRRGPVGHAGVASVATTEFDPTAVR